MPTTETPNKVTRQSTSLFVSAELWAEFKSVAALKGQTMTAVLETLIADWIAASRHETAA